MYVIKCNTGAWNTFDEIQLTEIDTIYHIKTLYYNLQFGHICCINFYAFIQKIFVLLKYFVGSLWGFGTKYLSK